MKRHEFKEYLIEHMGLETLLNDLVEAMSEKEAYENFEFICRMRDITDPVEEASHIRDFVEADGCEMFSDPDDIPWDVEEVE